MKVVDESLWQQQCAELTADGEFGQKFLNFVTAWSDASEAWMTASDIFDPSQAVYETLRQVEEQQGRLSVGLLGQALVLMVAHWDFGEALADNLSPIEQNLVQEITFIKIQELAREAEEEEQHHDAVDLPGIG